MSKGRCEACATRAERPTIASRQTAGATAATAAAPAGTASSHAVERVELTGGELELRERQQLLELLDVARGGDRRSDRRLRQKPRQRHRRLRRRMRGRDLVEGR